MIDKIIPPIAHAWMPSFTPAFRVFGLTYSGSQGKPFKSYPVLDGYPQGTTFVYRDPNLLYGVRNITRK